MTNLQPLAFPPPDGISAGGSVRVQWIASDAALQQLQPEWQQLWRQSAGATVFQSPEWLIPWWRHMAAGRLFTVAIRDAAEGRLVGLMPAHIHKRPHKPDRELLPLGIGTTDYLDGLWAAGWERAAAAAVLEAWRENSADWDVCDLPQLRPDSALLTAELPAGWIEEITASESCPAIALPSSPDVFYRELPARLAQNVRYYRRRAERAGRVEYVPADSVNLEELCSTLLRLHVSRWSERDLPGVLNSSSIQSWHNESMPLLLAAGLLRLFALRLDGTVIAVLYGLSDMHYRSPGRFYYYLGGFDPSYRLLSPGTLLISYAIEQAICEGTAEFDFLRGSEAYKYSWGAKDKPTCRRKLWHSRRSHGK